VFLGMTTDAEVYLHSHKLAVFAFIKSKCCGG